MLGVATLNRLLAYTGWANDVALKNVARLTDAQLHERRDALFRTVAGTFDHITVVAEMFVAHLIGTENPHRARRRAVELPFSEVARRLRAIDRRLLLLAGRYTEADFGETIRFAFVDGGEGAMTREDIFLHLVNHATYHRGFVSTLLFPVVGDSKASDFTVFLRDVWADASIRGEDQR